MDTVAWEAAGFTHDDELKSAHEAQANKHKMHDSGPYVVHGVWRRGLVNLIVEQNTAVEEISGGLTAAIQHPTVCVVVGPGGRAACNVADTALILQLAEELS